MHDKVPVLKVSTVILSCHADMRTCIRKDYEHGASGGKHLPLHTWFLVQTIRPPSTPVADAPAPRPAFSTLADDVTGQVKIPSNFFASQALKAMTRNLIQQKERQQLQGGGGDGTMKERNRVPARMGQIRAATAQAQRQREVESQRYQAPPPPVVRGEEEDSV